MDISEKSNDKNLNNIHQMMKELKVNDIYNELENRDNEENQMVLGDKVNQVLPDNEDNEDNEDDKMVENNEEDKMVENNEEDKGDEEDNMVSDNEEDKGDEEEKDNEEKPIQVGGEYDVFKNSDELLSLKIDNTETLFSKNPLVKNLSNYLLLNPSCFNFLYR